MPIQRAGPARSEFSVCPHCWHVNRYAARICGGCRADMGTLLQESGGLRQTAPVQSPVPVRARLTSGQRIVVIGFMALYALSILIPALRSRERAANPAPPAAPAATAAGAGTGTP